MGCGSSSPSSSLEPIADAAPTSASASASTPPNQPQPQPQSSIQSPTQPPVESAPQEDAAKDVLPVKESPDDGNTSTPEPIGSDPAGVGELTSEPPPTNVTDHAHTPAQTEPPTSDEKEQVKEEGESDEKAALPPVEAEKEVSKKNEADEDKNNDATPPSSSSSPIAEVDTAVAPAGVDEVAASSEIPSVESTQAAEPPQASVEAPQKEEETVSETKAEAASKPASTEAPSSLTSSSSALEPNVVEAPVAAAPLAEKSDTVESSSPVAELPKPDRPAKPQAVFVLGGPGSGKGTQCANIVNQFGWVHLSAGDLLREERKKNGPHAALIEEYIIQGKIVPADLTVLLLKNAMEENVAKDKTQFLIDGFPRNIENLSGWKKVIGGSVDLLFVLFFDCSEEKMRERLLNRGLTSGRSDDNEEAIVKRFLTYQTESRTVIKRYDQNGRVRRVDANKSAEEVWSEVHQIFAPIHRFASSVPASLTTSTPSAAPAIAGSSPMTH